MHTDHSLELAAPAKLNLGLSVLGKRPDGFHDILSVFQTISLTDSILLTDTVREISMTRDAPGIPSGPDNLVWKAAEAVRAHFGIKGGVHMELRKRIPSGAGLGGGSSDAAAVIRGLVELWNIDATSGELHEIAARLGSDVPFFLIGGTALVEGRGERITPLVVEGSAHFIVATPRVHVATGWAYGVLPQPFSPAEAYRSRISRLARGELSLLDFCAELKNDFEAPVSSHHPEIAEARSRLLDAGATHAMMTGSGSAVFGVFASEHQATAALAALPDDVPAVRARAIGPGKVA